LEKGETEKIRLPRNGEGRKDSRFCLINGLGTSGNFVSTEGRKTTNSLVKEGKKKNNNNNGGRGKEEACLAGRLLKKGEWAKKGEK